MKLHYLRHGSLLAKFHSGCMQFYKTRGIGRGELEVNNRIDVYVALVRKYGYDRVVRHQPAIKQILDDFEDNCIRLVTIANDVTRKEE